MANQPTPQPNALQTNPVVTAGTIAGLLGAFYAILVAQGVFDFLKPEAQLALNAFVALALPILAAVMAARLVTPTVSPVLPIGTTVNANTRTDDPTGVVTATAPQR